VIATVVQMRNLMRRIETRDHNFNLSAQKAARASLSLIGAIPQRISGGTRPRIQRILGSFFVCFQNFISFIKLSFCILLNSLLKSLYP
jgi:hypothetical protein